jgi:DNA-binding response OmpR family regulator
MATITTTNIYIAIRDREDRSHIEDQLVLDGADVSTFASASDLWERFQIRPARFVVTDRRFGDAFDGLELVRQIRKNYQIPYVYILMRSVMTQIKEIREGLDLGVDDYLVRPHNPFQIRSRVLVGMRWITYIDSIMGTSTANSNTAAQARSSS